MDFSQNPLPPLPTRAGARAVLYLLWAWCVTQSCNNETLDGEVVLALHGLQIHRHPCSVAQSCLFVTLQTVAYQPPLSTGFSRQEYWSGLPFPPPGDLLHPEIELVSPALAGRFFFFFTAEPPEKPTDIFSRPFILELQMLKPARPILTRSSERCHRPHDEILNPGGRPGNYNKLFDDGLWEELTV